MNCVREDSIPQTVVVGKMDRRIKNTTFRYSNENWQEDKRLLKHRDEHLSKDLTKSLSSGVNKVEDTVHVRNSPLEGSLVSAGARSRLLRDFYRLQCDPPSGVSGAPIDTDITQWQGIIFGPTGSPWEGGIFKVGITFNDNYPFKAPCVRFLTKMFHPNIGPSGEISLGILGDNWNPVYDVVAILLSIQSLLCEPNTTCTAGLEASMLFLENKIEYNRRIKEIVQRSWTHES